MVIRGLNDSSPGHVFGLHLVCASGSAEEVSQPRRRLRSLAGHCIDSPRIFPHQMINFMGPSSQWMVDIS